MLATERSWIHTWEGVGPAKSGPLGVKSTVMATVKLDTLGLECPQPILKMTSKLLELEVGDILEVAGDCSTFEDDVRKWCERTRKTLLAVNINGSGKVVQIQI